MNHRLALRGWLVAAVLLAVGCTDPDPRGAAHVRATLADPAAVHRLTVTVTGPNINPIVEELIAVDGAWEANVFQIPAGPGATFTADAFNAANVRIYSGQATGVTIVADETVEVSILAQELNPQQPFDNEAPAIDSLVLSSSVVSPGGTIQLQGTAHDANSGDTLTYAWSASGGAFLPETETRGAASSTVSTVWTAPTTPGPVVLNLVVTDQKGAASAISATVTVYTGPGRASVHVDFNAWPAVQSVRTNPAVIPDGATVQLEATVSDLDGDALSFSWGQSNCGAFVGPQGNTAASPGFTFTSGFSGLCTFTVSVSDGRGGTNSGSLRARVGTTATVDTGSAIALDAVWQSTTTAAPDGTVTFRVYATEVVTGEALSFSWSGPSVGSFDSGPVANGGSQAIWTAPTCLSTGVTPAVQAVVSDGRGHSVPVSFPISGPGECMTVVGGLASAPVDSGGSSLVADLGAGNVVALSVPPGALDGTTPISVTTSAAPTGAVTPLFSFEPSGTVFAKPLTVRMPLPVGVTDGDLYWSRSGGVPGYDNIGGTVQLIPGSSPAQYEVVAEVSHFSGGYVGEAQSARTVTGAQVVTYQGSGRGIANVPQDFSSGSVSAFVLGDGGYVELPGLGYADGTFRIEGVPDGEFVLRAGSHPYGGATYVVTRNGTADLGYAIYGRPNVATTPPGATGFVNFQISNASPYETFNLVELLSPDSDTWAFDLTGNSWGGPGLANAEPALGATAYDLTVDLLNPGWGSLGHRKELQDSAVLAELSWAQSSTGVPYRAMKRVAVLPAFDVPVNNTPETALNIPVALQDLSASRAVNYDYRVQEFAALTGEVTYEEFDGVLEPVFTSFVSPNRFESASFNFEPYLGVQGVGGGLMNGSIGATADLAYIETPYGTPNLTTGSMSFGAPPNWGVFTGVGNNVLVQYRLPCPTDGTATCTPSGLTRPSQNTRGAGVFVNVDVATQPSGTLAPVVSPVLNPTLNGQPLMAPVSGVGATPTIAWDAPAIGTPDQYELTVRRLDVFVDGGGFYRATGVTVATVITPNRSLVIPPGILVPGQTYVFRIAATRSARPLDGPYRDSVPSALAAIYTDQVSP